VHNAPGVTVGSIEGSGDVFLGANNLTVGTNHLSTTFSGLMQDGGILGGTGGSLTKVGQGTLKLTGSNTYSGGTFLEEGVLAIDNSEGLATGTGLVQVDGGTLAGNGIISGAVTIGTGSGRGAFLAPKAVTDVQPTLTIQNVLTFNADGTYTCTFKAQQDRDRNRAKTDQVIANGVTINIGAKIELIGHITGALSQGFALTLISNTSTNAISGTFSNLPDGGIVTINGNNFQASYSGGDGNDLTLTVVP